MNAVKTAKILSLLYLLAASPSWAAGRSADDPNNPSNIGAPKGVPIFVKGVCMIDGTPSCNACNQLFSPGSEDNRRACSNTAMAAEISGAQTQCSHNGTSCQTSGAPNKAPDSCPPGLTVVNGQCQCPAGTHKGARGSGFTFARADRSINYTTRGIAGRGKNAFVVNQIYKSPSHQVLISADNASLISVEKVDRASGIRALGSEAPNQADSLVCVPDKVDDPCSPAAIDTAMANAQKTRDQGALRQILDCRCKMSQGGSASRTNLSAAQNASSALLNCACKYGVDGMQDIVKRCRESGGKLNPGTCGCDQGCPSGLTMVGGQCQCPPGTHPAGTAAAPADTSSSGGQQTYALMAKSRNFSGNRGINIQGDQPLAMVRVVNVNTAPGNSNAPSSPTGACVPDCDAKSAPAGVDPNCYCKYASMGAAEVARSCGGGQCSGDTAKKKQEECRAKGGQFNDRDCTCGAGQCTGEVAEKKVKECRERGLDFNDKDCTCVGGQCSGDVAKRREEECRKKGLGFDPDKCNCKEGGQCSGDVAKKKEEECRKSGQGFDKDKCACTGGGQCTGEIAQKKAEDCRKNGQGFDPDKCACKAGQCAGEVAQKKAEDCRKSGGQFNSQDCSCGDGTATGLSRTSPELDKTATFSGRQELVPATGYKMEFKPSGQSEQPRVYTFEQNQPVTGLKVEYKPSGQQNVPVFKATTNTSVARSGTTSTKSGTATKADTGAAVNAIIAEQFKVANTMLKNLTITATAANSGTGTGTGTGTGGTGCTAPQIACTPSGRTQAICVNPCSPGSSMNSQCQCAATETPGVTVGVTPGATTTGVGTTAAAAALAPAAVTVGAPSAVSATTIKSLAIEQPVGGSTSGTDTGVAAPKMLYRFGQ